MRLLIPLHRGGEIITWSGRDILGYSDAKYLTKPIRGYAPIYDPDRSKPKPDVLILVEGPMDAMRISAASRRMPWAAMALCGKHLGPDKLTSIKMAARTCSRIIVAMDADVAISTVYQIINEVRSVTRINRIHRARLPGGAKDPGDIPMEG
jgi:DNA primase